MISQDVIRRAAEFQEQFQSAKPFKHLVIDGFLEENEAEQALADFPSFDKKNAINEYGEVGGKAVNTKLAEISPFYKKLYEYLFSGEFLNAISDITGIPDLIGDPTMYGGGTHENLHGQELDPHVDFNYVAGGEAHRRMNLLIYLNKNWDSAWGGDLEIHSNPRDPDTNQVHGYRVDFNRAILFETNEYSWHGFPRVNLPPELRDTNSRKALSIYLYTRTRPSEEIAGTHGTFYVQRPLDERFKEGYTLTHNNVQEIRSGYRNRDRYIENYQKQEERFGREQDGAKKYIEELSRGVGLRTAGYVLQENHISGQVWPDGWASKSFKYELRAVRDIRSVELQGFLPETAPQGERAFRMEINDSVMDVTVAESGSFSFEMPTDIREGETFTFAIDCSIDYSLKDQGISDDARPLSYFISMILFESP